MGNLLCPLLADLFMDNLESKFLIHPDVKSLVFWSRYVDDCFCIIKDLSFNSLDNILGLLNGCSNGCHRNIKFTHELEVNNQIYFLDLTISKQAQNLSYKIYRKPSHTDHCINFNSNHPMCHKPAFFNSMFHRMHTIPMRSNDFSNELRILLQIAVENSFPITTT